MALTLQRLRAGVHPAKFLALNLRKERRTNPLRLDPTRTTLLRRSFESAVGRRFRRLRSHIREFMVVNDVLGLKKKTILSFMAVPPPRVYEFATDQDKVAVFSQWLQSQMAEDLLTLETPGWTAPLGSMAAGPWTVPYANSAYRRGALNAFLASRANTGLSESEELFALRLMTPERLSKIQLLATRSFEGMKGVSSTMAAEMNRILAQGLMDGDSVSAMAQEMIDRLDLAEDRALMIARTEIIHAHAEGQLDAFDELDVRAVGAKVEWITAGDEKVCPECATLEGKVFSIADARGQIPMHPNCRCSWTPA